MFAANKGKYSKINIQAFLNVQVCSLLLTLQMHLIILLLEMSFSTLEVYNLFSCSFQLAGNWMPLRDFRTTAFESGDDAQYNYWKG